MKKFLAVMLSIAMFTGVFTGCGKKSNDPSNKDGASSTVSSSDAKTDEAGTKKDKVKIALLTDEAGTQVFVLNMIEGLKASAEKHGFEAIIAESADAAAYEDNARALIEEGVDFIIGGSWQSGEAISKIAAEFPDAATYALIDAQVDSENVKCISFREQESAYLVGMLGAMVTEADDKKFGAVHVTQSASSFKWRYGFAEGVKRIKPDATFVFNYVGNYNDPAKAKEFALQQYEQGARFINAACAGGDKGVFEAAKEKGIYTSGQDVDLTSPDNPYVVSSQIKDTYATITHLIEKYLSEEWTSDNETWGIKEGAIGAVHITHDSKNPITDRLSEENIKTLKQVALDILNGNIDLMNVPAEEDYKF